MGSKLSADIKAFIRIKGSIILFLAMFFYGIGTGILAPMNAVYLSDHVGLSKVEVVLVFAVALLFNMGLTLTIGFYSDRMRRKKMLPLIAAVLCITGLLIYMRASSFAGALLGMAIATAPNGLIMGQIFAMARNHFTQFAHDIVEMCQLWLRASFSVGFFTGLLLGANLFLVASFRGVLWGNLAGYGCLIVLLLLYKEVNNASSGNRVSGGEPFSPLMLTALLMLSCGDAIRGLYLPLVIDQLFGSPKFISYIWSAQAVFELLFMTMAGYWAAKYGSKRIILLGAVFALITYVIYATCSSLWVFFIVQPMYSFYVSILYGVAMGYVQRMFINRTGFGSSLYVVISQTASLIGYFLSLIIHGITPHIFIIPIILVITAVAIIANVVYYEKRRHQHGLNAL